MRADKSALGFLGYEFRDVKDRRYGTGGNYLTYGPSIYSSFYGAFSSASLSVFWTSGEPGRTSTARRA